MMHELPIQRLLIASIKREMPIEWSVMRSELRKDFAGLMAGLPSYGARRDFGHIYAQRKAAMVIGAARYIAISF